MPTRPRTAEIMLLAMLMGVIFLSGVVVWAIIRGNPDADRINVKLDQQLELLNRQVELGVDARNANACTAYQNHRAIEDSIRQATSTNGDRAGEPRVLPSEETVKACKAIEIEIDGKGKAQVSNIPETDVGQEAG